MAGAGTGVPLVFRCAKGRSTLNSIEHKRTHVVRATGRYKQHMPGHAVARVLATIKIEYACSCGWTGWSRHAQMLPKLRSVLTEVENKKLDEDMKGVSK